MDSRIKNGLAGKFAPEDVKKIEAFLDRGFSRNGQVAIASIFLFAHSSQKSVVEVLVECEKEWDRNWNLQHPDLRGDPDAPGGAGNQNRVSLENIYLALGIPSPLEAGQKAIPMKPFKVKTAHSVYVFGEAGVEGERSISCEGKTLDFTRCRIAFLALGKRMQVEVLDDPNPMPWHTSIVVSIEE